MKKVGKIMMLSVYLMLLSGCGQKKEPVTASECQEAHMRRVESIHSFSSGDGQQRMMAESVATTRACLEKIWSR